MIRPTLLLLDDIRLSINFYQLEQCVKLIIGRPLPFLALQLFAGRWPWDEEPDNIWIDSFVQEGFGGRGDLATILTPEGAQRLIDVHFEEPFDVPSSSFYKLSRLGERKTGFYSVRENLARESLYDWSSDRETPEDYLDWYNS